MGWMTRYGKFIDDFAPPSFRQPIGLKHIIYGLFFLALLASCIAFFPLMLALSPKPELREYMPRNIHCATCKDIWQHNRDLFNRGDMLCYGPPTHNRPTSKSEEVMLGAEKRCWVVEEGHDVWLRPLQVTDEETKKWQEKQKFVIRGRQRQ